MTAVAGLVHRGRVYLGADSAGVAGWALTVRADEKVFTNGAYVFGFTDSYRMGQIIRYSFTPPAVTPTAKRDLPRFMSTRFIDALRKSLKAGGYAKTQNEVESGGTFLVGVAGRLFAIDSDYQVGEPLDKFAAVGCGEDLCLGSLHTTAELERLNVRVAPGQRLTLALEAAERHSAGVRRPFHYVSTT